MENFFDNDAFNNFINQDFRGLTDWINTLNPYEFAFIAAIAAFIIAPTLNANQQNSIGNFLEEIGQIILCIAAQKITVQQATQGNTASMGNFDAANTSPLNNNIYNQEIEYLKREIERLKNIINGNN